MPLDKPRQLRCFCSRQPLLAHYGLDETGKLYIHIKVYKQRRIYGEVVHTGGTVKIKCRECLHWYTVTIQQPNVAKLEETTTPPEAVDPTTAAPSSLPQPVPHT